MNITEKVSPMHPDKIADRIAGALVDYCYKKDKNPKCAFEVLIGHDSCFITGETSVHIPNEIAYNTAVRIANEKIVNFQYVEVPQDKNLADNQKELRCGDNGVFAGFPMPKIHARACIDVRNIYDKYPYDGKIVINEDTSDYTICWSNAKAKEIKAIIPCATNVNPIGNWTGGVNVDTGVTGRKLASDFYGIQKPLGGGTMHGKDLSKADCSVNIYCYLMAMSQGKEYQAICSIGDTKVKVNGEDVDFADIVKIARAYIKSRGGFEKFAEWGFMF